MTETQKIAYSYVRFSTRRQELGDSLRRQVKLAEEYAKENGLALQTQSFRDLGISGFKKQNLQKGALAAFIKAVKTGTIKPGCFLLIEQFDRLSRAQVLDAFTLLIDLIKSGVTVITLVDKKVWNIETMNEVSNILVSIILMSRAYEESDAKAGRLRTNWQQKKLAAAELTDEKRTRRIVTSECPRWLRPNDTKTGFVVDEAIAESVRKVFEERKDKGIVQIVAKANRENWPPPGKGPVRKDDESKEDFEVRKAGGPTWHTSTVGRLLKNRAVLGEYQPKKNEYVKQNDGSYKFVRTNDGEVIKDYYPRIIDEKTFNQAERHSQRVGRFPGRRDASLKNWLQGLLRCGACGNSFTRKNKDSKAQPEYARYYCYARIRGVSGPNGSMCPGSNAGELENAVIHLISSIAPAAFDGSQKAEGLKVQVDILETEVVKAKKALDRFIEAISSSDAPIQTLLPGLNEAQAVLDQKQAALKKARAELADLSGDHEAALRRISEAIKNVDSLDARAALREELSRLIEKINVYEAAGYIEVFLRGGDEQLVLKQPLRPDVLPPGIVFTQMTAAEHEKHLETWKPPSAVGRKAKKS